MATDPTPAVESARSVATPSALAAQSVWFDCGSDADCAEEDFCRYPQGECGGDGTCTAPPDVCNMDYRPVCGCDGETYMNACDAHSVEVSVAYDGDC